MVVDIQPFLIAQVSIYLLLNIGFGVLFFIRVYKLCRMASNLVIVRTKSICLKVILLILLIFFQFLDLIFSYALGSYWMNGNKNFALIDIAFILTFAVQIYIILKEEQKGATRAVSLRIFWSINLVMLLIEIIYIQVQTVLCRYLLSVSGITLSIFQAVAQLVLILISFFFERDSSSRDNLLPLIIEKRESDRLIQNNKLYIEFNRQFNVTMKESSYECEFKIAVYVDEEAHIITKKEVDFQNLSAEMQKLFPNSPQVFIRNEKGLSEYKNMMKYGEEKQKVFENYLIDITKTDAFYTEVLMEFLQINQLKRKLLIDKSQNANRPKRQSAIEEDEDKPKVPFFKVEEIDDKIHVSNPQILEIIINKTNAEIIQFQNKLLHEKKLNIEFLSEEPDNKEIIHFISRVVNSKSLWRSFADWFLLGRQLEDKIYHFFSLWNSGFKNISMEIIGHEIAFDKDGAMHTLYLISMHKKVELESSPKKSKQIGITLKKRYSDFSKLDKHIKKFIHQNNLKNVSMPSLPPKFSPFGSKTSPKSRQVYFDIYIKELVKIERINHCIKFLEFLEVDSNQNNVEECYPIEEDVEAFEISENSHMSDLLTDQNRKIDH